MADEKHVPSHVGSLNDHSSGSSNSGESHDVGTTTKKSGLSKILRDKTEMLEFGKIQVLKVSATNHTGSVSLFPRCVIFLFHD